MLVPQRDNQKQTPLLSRLVGHTSSPLSQEVEHIGNHLFRYLPFSAKVNQPVGCVCVLSCASRFICFSLPSCGRRLLWPGPARPSTSSNLPSSKKHVVTHCFSSFGFLPSSSHSCRVGGVEPTYTSHGSSALTQAMRPWYSISKWLVEKTL